MKRYFGVAALVSILSLSAPACADTITWAQWNPVFVPGASGGSASAALGADSVSYTGEVENVLWGYPSWTPSPPTFIGGTVGNAPPSAGGIVQLYGGQGVIDTLSFSSPVTNPVLAIWSLGQGGLSAFFDFSATPTYESGGPSAEYDGLPISVTGNIVSGLEGNGTVEFFGTFSSISWTNPEFENWYGFTVGEAVPEPLTLSLFGAGLAGVFAMRRRKKKTV